MLKGRITTAMLGERKERYFPLAVTFIFYVLTWFLFQKLPVYRFLHGFMLGSTLTVGVVLLATTWFKMSAHLAGIGGISALLFIMSLQLNTELFYLFLLSIGVGGLTGTARTYLGAHTLTEVVTGYFAGLLTMGSCLLFY
jgi:membrane-associated phospholipid phosphatase